MRIIKVLALCCLYVPLELIEVVLICVTTVIEVIEELFNMLTSGINKLVDKVLNNIKDIWGER